MYSGGRIENAIIVDDKIYYFKRVGLRFWVIYIWNKLLNKKMRIYRR